MTPRITRAPKKATVKPVAVKAPTAKPKLVSRPKPKTTSKPAPKPIETPLLGPPVVVAAPAPTTASTNGPLNQIPPKSPGSPVEQPGTPSAPIVPPLIITIPPESPTPPAQTVILTSSGDKKASGYAVVESETIPPATDTAVPVGYIVVESDATPPVPAPAESEATGLPLVAPAPTATEDAAKPANYLVVESELADTKKPGYTVVESDSEPGTKAPAESSSTGLPLTDAVPPGYAVIESDSTPEPVPAIPTVTIPPSHAVEDVSSIQIGDVLIIAVKVMPKAEPEAEP
ncbi:hypothetical protein [Armatimonas sp.]|uniref:hypothetical protein n=1 Tax=Armatimonas sp. TaxID=1872638 RepID=UPI00374D4534